MEVGMRLWDNDLQVVEITEVAKHSNPYSDTGETQTWHYHTSGESDTLSGRLYPYGRLVTTFEGRKAADYEPGTKFADIK